jgi:HAD superfamily hydrolase (TIGR01509 family)
LPQDWEDEFNKRLQEVFVSELAPVQGIVEALDAIPHVTCVASSGTQEKIKFSLTLTGLYDRFVGRIFSATEVSRGKPAPDLFLHAAERMHVVPRECVVVEDSAPGVTAALAAGMSVLGYAGGVTPAEKLKRRGAVVFNDMRDLPNLLGSV